MDFLMMTEVYAHFHTAVFSPSHWLDSGNGIRTSENWVLPRDLYVDLRFQVHIRKSCLYSIWGVRPKNKSLCFHFRLCQFKRWRRFSLNLLTGYYNIVNQMLTRMMCAETIFVSSILIHRLPVALFQQNLKVERIYATDRTSFSDKVTYLA